MKSLRQRCSQLSWSPARPSPRSLPMSGCYASGGAYIVEDVPPSAREESWCRARDSSGSTAPDAPGEDLGVARGYFTSGSARIRSMSRAAGARGRGHVWVDGGWRARPAERALS